MVYAEAAPSLIDTALPRYDVTITEQVVVAADQLTTYEAVRSLDFLTVRTPLLTAAMWLRALPARLAGKTGPPLPNLVIGEGMKLPGWLMLGERPDHEIAFGAVGKFWRPVITWRDVPAAEFAGFDEPGWGKIAANFTVTTQGPSASLLSYQCRTGTTDPLSRRRLRRYWWLIRPFVAHIMRATVRTIKANAEGANR